MAAGLRGLIWFLGGGGGLVGVDVVSQERIEGAVAFVIVEKLMAKPGLA